MLSQDVEPRKGWTTDLDHWNDIPCIGTCRIGDIDWARKGADASYIQPHLHHKTTTAITDRRLSFNFLKRQLTTIGPSRRRRSMVVCGSIRTRSKAFGPIFEENYVEYKEYTTFVRSRNNVEFIHQNVISHSPVELSDRWVDQD